MILKQVLTRIFLTAAITLCISLPVAAGEGAGAGDALKRIPVQDGGRVKPFDTFARESLQLIYGKQSYKGRSAADILLTFMLIPDHWQNEKIFLVRHHGLREALRLTTDTDKEVYHSPNELMSNDRVALLFQELSSRAEAQEKLNPYYQAIQTLQNQLNLYHGLRVGELFRVVPPTVEPVDVAEDDPMRPLRISAWLPVARLEGASKDAFTELTKAYVASIASSAEKDGEAVASPALNSAVTKFIATAQAVNPEKYADLTKIDMELHYHQFEPFKWSWILYLIAVAFLAAAWIGNKRRYDVVSWVFLLMAFGLQAYGMGLRMYLTGRPPVSNMFETIIWVPWVGVLSAMILEYFKRSRVVLLAASLVAALCLILSNLAPAVLDGSLQPLQPVLRDNFWLTVHVLVIAGSYGALFLAFALGDIMLVYFLLDEKKYAQQIKDGAHSIYRTIQIGVVMLAAGIITGGIWADYSWGRFWGWDPKETWSLIALLGYLALLHGRLVGWFKGFGMAVGAIVSFSLVIMAWYGVNFVLGAGLHTYGFGAGGVEYVSAFVAVHLLFVAYVATLRHSRLKSQK